MCCLLSPGDEVRIGIVLGGGRSSRMGTDKLELRMSGRTLLQHAVEAALRCSRWVSVVSPARTGFDDPRVRFVLEEPPGGGPAAGLAAALAQLCEESADAEVLVLAGDLANPHLAVSFLLDAELRDDGVVLVDEEGWPQHLAGRYRLAALREALGRSRGWRNRSLRSCLRPLNLARKNVPKLATVDLDTPDLARMHGVEGLPAP